MNRHLSVRRGPMQAVYLWAVLAACIQPNKEAVDDSSLTSIEIQAPTSKMFPSGSPEGKIKSISVTLTPIVSDEDRNICKELKESSKSLDYTKGGKHSMSYSILQVCSFTFTMKLIGAESSDVYYEGSATALSAQLRGQANYQLEISLNVTEKGAAAGFGALAKKSGPTTVNGSSDQGKGTQLSLASLLGKDSCNVTSLALVDREATVTREDPSDDKKIHFLSALQLNKNLSSAELNKKLSDACGSQYESYTLRCEYSIHMKTETFAAIFQETLSRQTTTPAFKIKDRIEIKETFALKTPYQKSEATIDLLYCLAKKP